MEETKDTKTIGEFISESKGDTAPVSAEPTKEATPETAVVETPAEPVKEPVSEVVAPVQEDTRQVNGLLSTIQSLREERRTLRERLGQYETTQTAETEAQPQPSDPRFTAMSEQMARMAHPNDYAEKFKSFESKCLEEHKTMGSSPTFEMVMNSVSPGEAAYQAGMTFETTKKYGTDIGTMIKNIREEVKKELEPEIRKSLSEELAGKLAHRQQTPTNISQARAAGGDTSAPWSAPSFSDELRRRKAR
jgi:hypothetical protein